MNITVATLRDVQGQVAGYAVGTAEELKNFESRVWPSNEYHDAAIDVVKAYATSWVQNARQEAEAAGVLVGENVFSTDISSQVKYVGILVYASMDKTYTGTWKTENNGFVTLDAAGVVVMCMFVMAYIQVCFAWEQYVLAQINAAVSVSEIQAIDFVSGRPTGTLPPAVIAGIQASVGALASTALSGSSLTVSGTAQVHKLKGTVVPSITGGPGAGSAGMVGLTTGSTDLAGQISVVASGAMSAESGAAIVTVTFSEPYITIPFVTFSAANLAAGNVTCAPYVATTTTGFSLCVGNNSGLTATTHLFNYMVIQ